MVKKLLIVLVGLLLVLLLGLCYFLTQPAPDWAQRQVKEEIQKSLAEIPDLKLIELKWEHSFFDFIFHRPGNLTLRLQWQDNPIELSGDLEVFQLDPISISYAPRIKGNYIHKVTFEGEFDIKFSMDGEDINKSTWSVSSKGLQANYQDIEFSFDLIEANSTASLQDLKYNIILAEGSFEQLEHSGFRWSGEKQAMSFTNEIILGEILYESSDISVATSPSKINLNLSMESSIQFELELQTGEGELAQGDDFYTLPLKEFLWQLKGEKSKQDLKFEKKVLYKNKEWLSLKADLPQLFKEDGLSQNPKVHLKLHQNRFEIDELNQLLKTALGYKWPEIEVNSGQLANSLIADLQVQDKSIEVNRLKVNTEMNSFTLSWPDKDFKLENLNWKSQFESDIQTRAYLGVEKIYFKNGSSKPIEFNFSNTLKTKKDKVQLISSLLNPVDYYWGKIHLLMKNWEFNWTVDKEKFLSWNSVFDLKLNPLKLEDMTQQLCIESKIIPPLMLESDELKVSSTQKQMIVDGEVTGQLFGGDCRFKDFKMFNFLSPRVESQFSFYWDDIRLDKLSQWANFGKMDGYLFGYFENAVFQGSIPTQFNSKIEISPRKSREVIFSGEAMHHFVQLVGGDSVDQQMPGPLKFLLFSWPTDLIGGYNVDYAGVSLYALDGSILLETLDPKKLIQITKPRHYILKGRRFNIELKSESYPVLVDAFQITTYLQGFSSYLSSLQSEEESSYNDSSEKKPEEKPDENKKCRLF